MKTMQVNLRLEPDLVRQLEDAAWEESLERGTLMRKLLIEALREWRLDHALKRYQKGEISLGKVVGDTGRSYWELLDIIPARGIAMPSDPELTLSLVRAAVRGVGRVAEHAPAYRADRGRRTTGAKRSPARAADTLPDFAPARGGVLLVGINPAPPSVRRGHYYQGKIGRQLWKRLESLGLLRDALPGLEDEAFVAAGNGLTDVVKRATASAAEVQPDEFRAGAAALRTRIAEWRPGLVLFPFKKAAAAALGGADVAAGLCGEIEGVPAFLLSGPYAAAVEAARVNAELLKLLATRTRRTK